MKKSILLLALLVLLVGCAQQEEVPSEVPAEEVVEEVIEEPAEEAMEEEVTEVAEPETPEIYSKCRYSVIAYGGCFWLNNEQSSFELTISSGAADTIDGLWFIINGMDETKYVKNTEDLVTKSSRSYIFIYNDLVDEIGYVKKFEVLPIETIEDREVACFNQRIAFVPENNCKLPPSANSFGE